MCRLQSEITAEHQKFENWRQENVRRRCVSDTGHHRDTIITRLKADLFYDVLYPSRWNYLPLIFQMLQMLVRIGRTADSLTSARALQLLSSGLMMLHPNGPCLDNMKHMYTR